MSTVSSDICSGNIARAIRQQINNSAQVLVHLTQSTEHVASLPKFPQSRRSFDRRHGDRCLDVPRTDSVDSDGRMDAIVAPFRGKVTSHLEYRSFARIVCNGFYSLVRNSAAHGGDENDASGCVLFVHDASDCLCTEESTCDIDVQDQLECFVRIRGCMLLSRDSSASDQTADGMRRGSRSLLHSSSHTDGRGHVAGDVLEYSCDGSSKLEETICGNISIAIYDAYTVDVNVLQVSIDGSGAMSVTTTSAPDWSNVRTRPIPSPPNPPVTKVNQYGWKFDSEMVLTNNGSVLESEQLRQFMLRLCLIVLVQLVRCITQDDATIHRPGTITERSIRNGFDDRA
jgi:hypothetical protein